MEDRLAKIGPALGEQIRVRVGVGDSGLRLLLPGGQVADDVAVAGVGGRILPVHRLPVSESAVPQGLARLGVAEQHLPLHGFGSHAEPPQFLVGKRPDIHRPLQRRGPAADNIAGQSVGTGRHDLVFRKLNGR